MFICFWVGMSFNTGSSSAVEDKNVFVPEELNRVELEVEEVDGVVVVAVYTMIDEDHGVGQLLRDELLRDPQKRVTFAAYRIPHPQEAVMKLRFHTTKPTDPQTLLDEAINRCVRRIDTLSSALAKKE